MHTTTKLLAVVVIVMLFTVVIVFTPLFRVPIFGSDLFTWRDVVEQVILTILLSFANYRIYIYAVSRIDTRSGWLIAFTNLLVVAGIVLSALGVGMRFAGNKIELNYCGTDLRHDQICQIAHLFHEPLGHCPILFGSIFMSLALLIVQLVSMEEIALDRLNNILVSVFGALSSLVLFALVIEGGIVNMGLPLITIYAFGCILIYLLKRQEISRLPLLNYKLIGFLLAVILVVAWGIYWRGFPEFSELNRAIIQK